MQGPRSICIQLLDQCNLKCPYCRSTSSPTGANLLELKKILNLIDNLMETGLERVSLTGGEPLLWSPLNILLKELVDRNLHFTLTTNGLLARPLFNIPSEYWNNGVLRVSIDGTLELHDQLRGKGTFNKTTAFLRQARKYLPIVAVNTLLIWNPIKWAKELCELFLSIGVDQWAIISPVKNGRWQPYLNEFEFNSSYVDQFFYIKKVVTQSNQNTAIRLSFWDFAKYENTHVNTIVIQANGDIILPGIYRHQSENLLAKTVSIYSKNATMEIIQSAEAFKRSGFNYYF